MRKVLVILLVLNLILANPFFLKKCFGQEKNDFAYTRAKIVQIISNDTQQDSANQKVEIMVMEGVHKGEKYEVTYNLNLNYSGEINMNALKVNDGVFVDISENEDGTVTDVFINQIIRDTYLAYLLIGFCILLIIIGKGKGIKAILSLSLTIVSIMIILLPAILQGYDPVIVTVIICIFNIFISLIIISGWNKKTLAAILGTTGGVVISGAIAFHIGTVAKITGMGQEETQMLLEIPQNIHLDFSGILFAGIIIGTMGATMDVGMSIASSMHEIKINSPGIKISQLIMAGMNVGRDAMATMANTLILAYTGGAIQLMLLLMAYETPFTQIINWDMIASEVLRAVSGSIGIVIAIPLTAVISGMVENRQAHVTRSGYVFNKNSKYK